MRGVPLRILIVVALSYATFVGLYTMVQKDREIQSIEKYVEFLKPHLWQMDYEMVEKLSNVIIEGSNVIVVRIFDDSSKVKIEVSRPLSPLEFFLVKVGLFWKRDYTRDVTYRGVRLERIGFTVLVKNFYVYLYSLVIAVLIYHLAVHYFRLKSALIELEKVNSELKSTVEELELTIEELERTQEYLITSEKMASIGRLIAGIAHDMNTPMGIVYTSLSELSNELEKVSKEYSEGRISKEQLEDFLRVSKDLVSLMMRNVKRVVDLVRSLKSVSAQDDYTKPIKFNVKKYMEDVLETLHPRLRKTNVKVHLECPEDLILKSYPGAIGQILSNLIENSIVHGFENGRIPGNIDIKVEDKGDYVEIVYRDNGKGMSPEIRDKVFEPFFTTKRETGGSGLGMAIVYSLVVEKLGGDIFLESSPGKGVKITITIPKKG